MPNESKFETKKHILGSGTIHIEEYNERLPESWDDFFGSKDNIFGAIKGGAELEYSVETFEDQSDLGEVKIKEITAEDVVLRSGIADCCCTTQRAIDNVNYNMATNTCALQNTMNNNTRDIIDSQNAGTRAILDYLCQDKISTLQNENQALRLAASQSNQNAVLMAAMDANKADILRRTGAECPTAAYIVQPPTPVTFPTNCCGQATFGGNGCGNNCNSGCGF